MKHCPGCKEDLPLSSFPVIKKRGDQKPGPRCVKCRAEQQKAAHAKFRDKRLAEMKGRREQRPEAEKQKRRQWYAMNRDSIIARRRADPGVTEKETQKNWQYRLKKKGLTVEDYDWMLKEQGGVCKICKATKPGEASGKTRVWSVDHCHETGKVRGLLCHRCNLGLGLFRDRPDLLVAAIEYLKGSN
jgi:hypothetical protein